MYLLRKNLSADAVAQDRANLFLMNKFGRFWRFLPHTSRRSYVAVKSAQLGHIIGHSLFTTPQESPH